MRFALRAEHVCWLKLRYDAKIRHLRLNTDAIISFVVVFPALPVTAMIGLVNINVLGKKTSSFSYATNLFNTMYAADKEKEQEAQTEFLFILF